ncbi:hypothetical protein B0H13DRAFT_1859664 [Mycena leptocephala]|nr:hypothetical protein B0H13DRAFT_1859664 [Mycena leptocephala]
MNPRNWSLAIVSTQGFRTNTGSSFKIVYYRVYTPDAAIHSKSAWDAKDQFLGRIAANSIPPPHNVGSLKRCIAHTEGLLEACRLRRASVGGELRGRLGWRRQFLGWEQRPETTGVVGGDKGSTGGSEGGEVAGSEDNFLSL